MQVVCSRLPVGAVPVASCQKLGVSGNTREPTPVAFWCFPLCEDRFDCVAAEDFLQSASYQVVFGLHFGVVQTGARTLEGDSANLVIDSSR